MKDEGEIRTTTSKNSSVSLYSTCRWSLFCFDRLVREKGKKKSVSGFNKERAAASFLLWAVTNERMHVCLISDQYVVGAEISQKSFLRCQTGDAHTQWPTTVRGQK